MNYNLAFFLLFVAGQLLGQETINRSLMHDGIERDMIIYLPENYTGNNAVPLVFNFHGFTSNAFEQMNYGDFRAIADREGFIIVHPLGTEYLGNTHFNVGGFTVGSTVDDVGFTETMIDSLIATYNIDEDRIYSTGMSNGGFMSFLLACQLGERIAAVASVTGSMTPETFDNCEPAHPTPILQIHGDSDNVVPYDGAIWSKSIASVLEYWVEFDNCDIENIPIKYNDINMSDGSTAEHWFFSECNEDISVEHIKITGGGHTWPGTAFNVGATNQDINASQLIWEFFDKYDLKGRREVSSTINSELEEIAIFPNPVMDQLTINRAKEIDGKFQILNFNGQQILKGVLKEISNQSIDVSLLEQGIYILKIGNEISRFIKI